MANKSYGYQYETSPRKLEPEYQRPKVKKKKIEQKKKVQKQNKNSKKVKAKKKKQMSFEMKFFFNSMLVFIVIFAIIACEALVAQRYKEKEGLKKEYNNLLSSTNIGIDSNDDVRFIASEYGMQTKSATLIDLGTSDYIESSENKVKMDDDNILTEIINWIKSIF